MAVVLRPRSPGRRVKHATPTQQTTPAVLPTEVAPPDSVVRPLQRSLNGLRSVVPAAGEVEMGLWAPNEQSQQPASRRPRPARSTANPASKAAVHVSHTTKATVSEVQTPTAAAASSRVPAPRIGWYFNAFPQQGHYSVRVAYNSPEEPEFNSLAALVQKRSFTIVLADFVLSPVLWDCTKQSKSCVKATETLFHNGGGSRGVRLLLQTSAEDSRFIQEEIVLTLTPHEAPSADLTPEQLAASEPPPSRSHGFMVGHRLVGQCRKPTLQLSPQGWLLLRIGRVAGRAGDVVKITAALHRGGQLVQGPVTCFTRLAAQQTSLKAAYRHRATTLPNMMRSKGSLIATQTMPSKLQVPSATTLGANHEIRIEPRAVTPVEVNHHWRFSHKTHPQITETVKVYEDTPTVASAATLVARADQSTASSAAPAAVVFGSPPSASSPTAFFLARTPLLGWEPPSSGLDMGLASMWDLPSSGMNMGKAAMGPAVYESAGTSTEQRRSRKRSNPFWGEPQQRSKTPTLASDGSGRADHSTAAGGGKLPLAVTPMLASSMEMADSGCLTVLSSMMDTTMDSSLGSDGLSTLGLDFFCIRQQSPRHLNPSKPATGWRGSPGTISWSSPPPLELVLQKTDPAPFGMSTMDFCMTFDI